MAPRYSVRVTRFRDQQAFEEVVGFLVRLYPDRAAGEFEVGLARLPCLLSHDASGEAAEALRESLTRRGADVLLHELEVDAAGDSVADATIDTWEDDSSLIVDASFLAVARSREERPRTGAPSAEKPSGRGERRGRWRKGRTSSKPGGKQDPAPWES